MIRERRNNLENANLLDLIDNVLALVVQTVDSTDRWGYINKKGEWVIPPQFADADHFYGGLAYVILSDDPKDRRSGYINHRGQVVWQFKDKYPVEILRF